MQVKKFSLLFGFPSLKSAFNWNISEEEESREMSIFCSPERCTFALQLFLGCPIILRLVTLLYKSSSVECIHSTGICGFLSVPLHRHSTQVWPKVSCRWGVDGMVQHCLMLSVPRSIFPQFFVQRGSVSHLIYHQLLLGCCCHHAAVPYIANAAMSEMCISLLTHSGCFPLLLAVLWLEAAWPQRRKEPQKRLPTKWTTLWICGSTTCPTMSASPLTWRSTWWVRNREVRKTLFSCCCAPEVQAW